MKNGRGIVQTRSYKANNGKRMKTLTRSYIANNG
ncbi:hypothetical protein KSS87_003856 [Heliosperma pusillum]|nr:hypothetical protein KSS87_003856 [Heliosperma pusillum]